MGVLFCLIFIGILGYINYRSWGKSAVKKINDINDRQRAASAPQEIKDKVAQIKAIYNNNDYDELTYADINSLGCIMYISGYTSARALGVCFFEHDSEIYAIATGMIYVGSPSFAVKPVSLGNYNYHPSDIRYVSATVGGVTTGGFYDAGNYVSKDYESTGKSQLYCKICGTEMTVDELVLNEELYKVALKDKKILPFINKHSKTVKLAHATKTDYTKQFHEAFKVGGYMAAKNIENMNFAETLLEKGEATYFRDWIISHL